MTNDLQARLLEDSWVNASHRGVRVRDMCIEAAAEIARLTSEVERLEKDNEEMTFVFDTGWEADQRAIKDWQEITGRKLVWPDRADMVVGLLMQRDMQDTELDNLQAKADALAEMLKLALDNIQGIADGTDIPSTAIRQKGRAALTAFQEGK